MNWKRAEGRPKEEKDAIFDAERFGEVWHDVLTMFNALCVTISLTLFDCW